jgi:hypothetical protein
MRIAYVFDWVESRGVLTKVGGQLAAWRDAGHEADLFVLRPRHLASVPLLADYRTHTYRFSGAWGRVRATSRLVDDARKYLPDVVYLRYDLFFPQIRKLATEFPTVVEVNTLDTGELAALQRPMQRLYNRLNRRLLLGSASGFACVTHELASQTRAMFNRPTVVVANGIDLKRASVRPRVKRERTQAVFVGYPEHPWLGLDKLVWLAPRLPEVDFALIGTGERATGSLPPNVRSHNELGQDEITTMLSEADVAFGTLALHRNSMQEACPLKTRQYLAHGLPVVIGYDDTDFLDMQPWFLLRLPNTESNVSDNVDAIRAFIRRARDERVGRSEVAMRIDLAAKEKRRLAFMRELLEASDVHQPSGDRRHVPESARA